jgi:hypothetical protein
VHAASFAPILAYGDHLLLLEWVSSYKYQVINTEECSCPVSSSVSVMSGSRRCGNVTGSSRISSDTAKIPNKVGDSRAFWEATKDFDLVIFGECIILIRTPRKFSWSRFKIFRIFGGVGLISLGVLRGRL